MSIIRAGFGCYTTKPPAYLMKLQTLASYALGSLWYRTYLLLGPLGLLGTYSTGGWLKPHRAIINIAFEIVTEGV